MKDETPESRSIGYIVVYDNIYTDERWRRMSKGPLEYEQEKKELELEGHTVHGLYEATVSYVLVKA